MLDFFRLQVIVMRHNYWFSSVVTRFFSWIRRLLQSLLLSYIPGSSKRWGPPRRYCFSAIDGLARSPAQYLEIYPPSSFQRSQPFSCELNPPAVFMESSLQLTPSDGVFSLLDGRVFGCGPTVITACDCALLDVSMEWAPFHGEVYRQWKLPAPRLIDGPVLVLAGMPGSNYGHWFHQMLPRLHLAESAGYKTSDFAAFIINSGAPFIAESLRLLGIPVDRCISTAPNLHFQGKQLIVPSIPSPGNPSPWVAEYLRKSFWPFVQIPNTTSPKRLFISRSRAASRRIANEDKLLPLLDEKGFSVICLEDLLLQHQIELFANADVVCGVHGSGLTNVFFCKPGSTLIEIYHPQFPEICWWSMASISCVHYFYMLGDGPSLDYADMQYSSSLNQLDVVCDPAKLRKTFKLAGF